MVIFKISFFLRTFLLFFIGFIIYIFYKNIIDVIRRESKRWWILLILKLYLFNILVTKLNLRRRFRDSFFWWWSWFTWIQRRWIFGFILIIILGLFFENGSAFNLIFSKYCWLIILRLFYILDILNNFEGNILIL